MDFYFQKIFPLFACFLIGALMRWRGKLPAATPEVLGHYVMEVAAPALILLTVPTFSFESQLLVAALMPWLVFLASWALFHFLGKRLRFQRASIGCLVLVAGMGNTAFVGFPMTEALFGGAGLPTAIVIDQLGSFLLLSTLGLAVAGFYSGAPSSPRALLRRLLRFTPFQAFMLALLLRGVVLPEPLRLGLKFFGDTLGPVALFAVGYQLRFSKLSGALPPLSLGLAFKLAFAPLLIALLYGGFFALDSLHFRVTVFEAAMPPMISAGIIAVQQDLDAPLASLLVSLGILLSFFSLPWVFHCLEMLR